jgi:hypothetical protein
MGKFKQGESGNLAGRPKGVKNKSSEQLRRTISRFISGNLTRLQSDFEALKTPRERLAFIEKMLKFILPPPQDELTRLSDQDLDRLINKLKNRQI